MTRELDHRPKSRAQNGMAIFLVMGLVMILTLGIGLWYFVLSGEARGTNEYAQRLTATTFGEGAANLISAHVNRHLWKDRFYAKLGVETPSGYSYEFSDTSYPFFVDQHESLGAHGRLSWSSQEVPHFEGFINDLPEAQSYRIKLRVTLAGFAAYMTWDKTWNETFLGSLNASNDTVMTRSVPLETSEVDQLLNEVKTTARGNIDIDPGLRAQLDQLINALKSGTDSGILLVP